MRMTAWLMGLLLCASASADEPWNQFRGPRGDGTSTADVPVEFSEKSHVTWKTAVPGRGWSSPVAWGDRIWLTNGPEIQNTTKDKPKLDQPLKLTAVCVDAGTGKILLDLVLFEVDTPQFTHATNSYASCTPFIDNERVYIHFGAYGTACLNSTTGAVIWKRNDLPCDHFRGPGSSPFVFGDLLYLTFDGYDQQYIAALDKMTGKTVWRRDRGIDFGTTDGDAKKGYSTPLLITVAGRQLLVSPFAAATIAYDPLTGEPIWTVRHGGMNAAGRPLFGNGLVYINSADGPNPLIAVPADGSGDVTSRIAWRSNKAIPKRPSQLLAGDLLFLINDGGVASCLEAATGKELWTKRLPGEYWASPLLANGLVYIFSQQGHVHIFKAAREFEMVAEAQFEDGFIASPAVVDNALILRSKKALYRIDK